MTNLFDFSEEKLEEKPVEEKLPDIFIDSDNSKLIKEIEENWAVGKWKITPPILIGTYREKRVEYIAIVPIDKTIKGYTLRAPKNNDPVTIYCERGIKFFDGKTEYDTNYFEACLYMKYDFIKFKFGILFAFED